MQQKQTYMIPPLWYQIAEDGTAAVVGCLPTAQEINVLPQVRGAVVTRIDAEAFQWHQILRRIQLPETLESIGRYAFCGCEKLRSIVLPAGVRVLEEACFAQCFQLKQIQLPNALEAIEPYAFKDCLSLETICIPRHCTQIALNAFEECASMTAYQVENENPAYCAEDGMLYNSDKTLLCLCPESREEPVTLAHNTAIARETFDRCMLLPSIEVEEGHPLYRSEDGVLFSADGTTLVCVPQGRRKPLELSADVIDITEFALDQSFLPVIQVVKDLVDFAWIDTCSLPPFRVDEDNPAFSAAAGLLYDREQTILFACYGNFQGRLVLPDSVTIIDVGAVSGCGDVTAVELPPDLQIIENAAFAGCLRLVSVDIPASVTTLGDEAFLSCFALQHITIPNPDTEIGKDAFLGCLNLTIHAPRHSHAAHYARIHDIPLTIINETK